MTNFGRVKSLDEILWDAKEGITLRNKAVNTPGILVISNQVLS